MPIVANPRDQEAVEALEKAGVYSIVDYFRGYDWRSVTTKLMSLADKTAAALHEDWRRSYASNPENYDENGQLKPRWKVIKDADFISKLDPTELPDHIRVNDNNQYEIDINNPYDMLSPDWQRENYEAAKVAAAVVMRASVDPSLTRDEVGTIIHDAWLERNPWAADGPQGKPFVELDDYNKSLDMRQFDLCAQVAEADSIMGTDD